MQGGRIRRELLPFEDRYAQIPNAWLRDRRLSYRARGVLGMLLSHRQGWTVGIREMTTDREGRDAVRSAVSELEALGYVRRERVRDDAGKLGRIDWILSQPVDNPVESSPPMTD